MRGFSVFILCFAVAAPVAADVKQVFVSTSYGRDAVGTPHPQNNKIFRIPLDGPLELIDCGVTGLDAPYAMAINRETGRLYVANDGTGEILEIEVNADGTLGASSVFSSGFPYPFASMAIRPSSGQIYVGVKLLGATARGIYRVQPGEDNYERITGDDTGLLFYSDCWIEFDPSNDGVVYVTGGDINTNICVFDADNGADLGFLSSYNGIIPPPAPTPHPEGYFIPHQVFIPAGGGDYHLLVNAHYVPENQPRQQQKRLLLFDPDADQFLGELPDGGPSILLPTNIIDCVKDTVNGKVYAGTNDYADVHEIPANYSEYTPTPLFDYPELPYLGNTRVEMSYGRSPGGSDDTPTPRPTATPTMTPTPTPTGAIVSGHIIYHGWQYGTVNHDLTILFDGVGATLDNDWKEAVTGEELDWWFPYSKTLANGEYEVLSSWDTDDGKPWTTCDPEGTYGGNSITVSGAELSGIDIKLFDVCTPTPIPISTQSEGEPQPAPASNYINLNLVPSAVDRGGKLTMAWSCDFSRWNYQGATVDIYLAAIRGPVNSDTPSTVADALAGGAVYLFEQGMKTAYVYDGSVRSATWSGVAFPPVAFSGNIAIAVPSDPSFAGDYVFATAFIRRDTGGFVRGDGLPVENSNKFSVE